MASSSQIGPQQQPCPIPLSIAAATDSAPQRLLEPAALIQPKELQLRPENTEAGRGRSIQQRAPRGSSSILANQAKRNDLRARNIQLRERGERTETDPQITPGEIERLKAFERLTSIDRPCKYLAGHRKMKSDGKLDTHKKRLKRQLPT